MKNVIRLFACYVLFPLVTFGNINVKKPAVLVFSLTKGYRHKSIPAGKEAIQLLAKQNKYQVDTTESASYFTDANLKKYKAIIFLCPTGTDVFSPEEKTALQNFVHRGGGIVGIHAATDFCYEWEWYGKMMGAYFESHPKVQPAKLMVVDNKSPITKGLPQLWEHTDEWYNFKSINPDIKVLVKLDESSYTGGKMGNNHPISWTQEFEGGRVFYTELGHTPETYQEKLFLNHLENGLKWVLN